jgi:hypothetical protein
MGELSDALDEFQEASEKYYQKIMEILEDKYCWKCPMRTNRKVTLCREVEAWIRLTEAMERGVREKLGGNNHSIEDMEVITAKFLEKSMKSEKKMDSPGKHEDHLIIKLEEDAEPYAVSGDFIFVKTQPLKVKGGDLVLMPRACPLATYWYIKTTKHSTVPFKIFKVSRVFQKRATRYIESEEGLVVPTDFLIGVVQNIMGYQDLSMHQEKKGLNYRFND